MKELGDGDITTAMDLARHGQTAASWLGRVCRRSLHAQIQASGPTVCAARKHVDKRPDFGGKVLFTDETRISIRNDCSKTKIRRKVGECLLFVTPTVKQKQGELVSHQKHYGGVWYVSGTSDFQEADLQTFYIPLSSTNYKHNTTGIALHKIKWLAFKRVVEHLHQDIPINFTPCIHNQDHSTPEAITACQERNPLHSTMNE